MSKFIRPAKKPYIVFGVIFGFLLLLALAVYVKTGDSIDLIHAGIPLLGLSGFWIWIFLHLIELADDRITVGRIKVLQRSLKRNEVADWYTFMGFRDHRGRTGPFVRLVIEPKPSSGKKPIILPAKLFAPEDLKRLDDFLSHSISGKNK